MESLNYVDKQKMLKYIVEEAKRQKMPIFRLCDGIIDPSNFTKMYKGIGNRTIKFETLMKLATKLKITEEALIIAATIENVEVHNKFVELQKVFEKRNYALLLNKLNEFEASYTIDEVQYKQLLLRYRGIVNIIEKHSRKEGTKNVIDALRLTIPDFVFPMEVLKLGEQEIDIYNSLIYTQAFYNNYIDLGLEEYEKLLNYIEGKPMRDEVISRIYYNYAVILKEAKRYDEAIDIAKMGLTFDIDNNALILLPYYYHLLYKIHDALDNKDLAEDCYQKSVTLMEVFKVPDNLLQKVKEAHNKLDIGFWRMDD